MVTLPKCHSLPTYLLLVVDNWNQYCKSLLLVTDGPVMNYVNYSCCGWGRDETAERQSFPTPQINSSNPVIGNFYYVFGNCTDETRAGECSIFWPKCNWIWHIGRPCICPSFIFQFHCLLQILTFLTKLPGTWNLFYSCGTWSNWMA